MEFCASNLKKLFRLAILKSCVSIKQELSHKIQYKFIKYSNLKMQITLMTLQIKSIYKIINLCGNYLQVAIQQKKLMVNF
jgi:hypothetical protein